MFRFRKFFILTVLVSLPCYSGEGLSEGEVVDKLISDTNKKYGSYFSISKDDVFIGRRDVDKNGSEDLLVFYDGRCGMSRGCEMDIYLCLSASSCEVKRYCYAGTLYEGQIKNKGTTLNCENPQKNEEEDLSS